MLLVENLDLFYGAAQALDRVSLSVDPGSIVAIVGANGAGKTSLIQAIAGMHRPFRGSIRFRATEIGGLPSHRVCNFGIGQVAEGRQIFPTLSVNENLEIGAMLPRARGRHRQNRERVFALFPTLAQRSRRSARRSSFCSTSLPWGSPRTPPWMCSRRSERACWPTRTSRSR